MLSSFDVSSTVAEWFNRHSLYGSQVHVLNFLLEAVPGFVVIPGQLVCTCRCAHAGWL